MVEPPAFSTLPEETPFIHANDTPTMVTARTGALFLLNEDKSVVQQMRRLPIIGVLHKTEGRGAPHAFYAFSKQWPGFPCVVIFLNVPTFPYPRLPDRRGGTSLRASGLSADSKTLTQFGFPELFGVNIDEIMARATKKRRSVLSRRCKLARRLSHSSELSYYK